MRKAAERVLSEVAKGAKILVFGDYDTDGITGSTIVYKGLVALGHPESKIDIELPNRELGYSIKFGYVKEYFEKPVGKDSFRDKVRKLDKVDFIITADCGTNSVDDIRKIGKEFGIPVGVTDHHHIGAEVDFGKHPAEFVVNQLRKGKDGKRTYPNEVASGSLVALKFVEAMDAVAAERGGKRVPPSVMEELRDIAAVGVITDVMPIVGENSEIVKDFLLRASKSPNPGLAYLSSKILDGSPDSARDTTLVGFGIGPRFNAGGRMDSAFRGLLTLFAKTDKELEDIFANLNSVNSDRQSVEREVLDGLVEEAGKTAEKHRGICAFVKDTPEREHEGIQGLLAGRVKEKFYRPTVVCTVRRDGTTKCSGRSVEGFVIIDAITALREYFAGGVAFGGHEYAFGGTLEKGKEAAFKKAFEAYCDEHVSDDALIRKFRCVGPVKCATLAKYGSNVLATVEKYGPFGKDRELPFVAVDLSDSVSAVYARKKDPSVKDTFFRLKIDREHQCSVPFFGRDDIVKVP